MTPPKTSADLRLFWTEQEFLDAVVHLARACGWKVNHQRPAMTRAGWRTATQGNSGWPDLCLARGGRVIVAELKTETGKLTVDQRLWLDALGKHGRLWRPSDWAAIVAELTAKEV